MGVLSFSTSDQLGADDFPIPLCSCFPPTEQEYLEDSKENAVLEVPEASPAQEERTPTVLSLLNSFKQAI